MTKRQWIAFIGALFLATTAGQALAEDEETDYQKLGPFIGVGTGVGWTNIRADADIDTNVRLSGHLGVRVARPYAIDIHVEQLWNAQGPNDTTTIMIDNRIYPTGFMDGTHRLQPYGVLGVGLLIDQRKYEKDETGFAMRFGLGIDYYLNESFSVVGETGYVMATDSKVDDRDYFSFGIGLQYRFD